MEYRYGSHTGYPCNRRGVNAGSAAPENTVNGKPYPGKFSLQLKAGDSLRIKTPGGGGYTNNLRVSK